MNVNPLAIINEHSAVRGEVHPDHARWSARDELRARANVSAPQPYTGFVLLLIGARAEGKDGVLKNDDPLSGAVILEIPQADRSALDRPKRRVGRKSKMQPDGSRVHALERS